MNAEVTVVTAAEVFSIDEKIRWVAVTTSSGHVIINEMRPGVRSYSPTKADEEFAELGP